MEETSGQQYALQVAVQTMKERCLQLQQRLSIVEEENMNLRVKYHIDGMDLTQDSNKSEMEILHQKIVQLNKQKSQLTHNVLMVATENRHLWNRLSKLTQANQTLGDHLTKISDTLNQSTIQTPSGQAGPPVLIRSKTFTHETPPKLVRRTEEEKYSDTSLEDISLKIINSIAQEKYELEKQCAQMVEMQTSDTFLSNSIGFAYPHDVLDDCLLGEIAQNMEKLIYIKDALIQQREKLKKGFETLKYFVEGDALCKGCKDRQNKEKELEKLSKTALTDDAKLHKASSSTEKADEEKICPVCNKLFIKENIRELVKHVESHFVGEDDAFLDHFEVIREPEVIPFYPAGIKK